MANSGTNHHYIQDIISWMLYLLLATNEDTIDIIPDECNNAVTRKHGNRADELVRSLGIEYRMVLGNAGFSMPFITSIFLTSYPILSADFLAASPCRASNPLAALPLAATVLHIGGIYPRMASPALTRIADLGRSGPNGFKVVVLRDNQRTQLMSPIATQALVAFLLSTLIYYAPIIYRNIVNNIKLRSIPTVGCSGLLTSYLGAHRFLKNAKSIVQEGYDKYRGSIFKVSTMRKWIIVVSGSDKIDDIRRASDEYLSLNEAENDAMHLDVSFGSNVFNNPVQTETIRNPLTRNIAAKYNDVREEILAAFDDHIPIRGEEWVKITVFPTMREIVCRAGNRMLVGLPLCRDPEYLDLSKNIAIDIVAASVTLNNLPPFLKPIASRFLQVSRTIQRAMNHVEPFVKERLEQEEIHGKVWADKPNDVFTWLAEVSNGKQSLKYITSCLLLVNLAAVEATTNSFTNALFDLATYPEYVQPLRKEVEEIVQQEGWSKASMGKMSKLDSFAKESMRLTTSVFGLIRKVMKDFTFSDGTTIPAGNTISVPALCMHTDPDIYPYPNTFDGFRFEKLREKEGENSKHQFVSIELDYLLFGQGRHACPGRFFAANELKTLLAHVLMNYDVKLADGGGRPQPISSGASALIDPLAKLLFRKRV